VATVRLTIAARVGGRVEGTWTGSEESEIKDSAYVEGDTYPISAQRRSPF
jgi:hypothetical protein